MTDADLDRHQERVVDGALGRDMCVLAGAGTGKRTR